MSSEKEQVERYYRGVPEQRLKKLRHISNIITQNYPEIEVSMNYKIPTFNLGKNWVAIANHNYYISVYTCSYDHISGFKKKYPKIKTGKGCINFRDKDEIPFDEITEVIKRALTMKK